MHVYVRKLHWAYLLRGESFGIELCQTTFFPHEQKKIQRRVCVYACVSVKTYPLVALVLEWLILRYIRNLLPFWGSAPCQLFGPFFFLQCIIFVMITLCRCIWEPNAYVCKWQTAASACTGIWLCARILSRGGCLQVLVEISPLTMYS